MTARGGARGTSYWAEFPDTYHAEHVEAIAKWIAVGESGVVILTAKRDEQVQLGWLLHHPHRHPVPKICQVKPDDYAFIHMDVNSLPTVSTPYFYHSMLLGLQNAARQIDPSLAQEIPAGDGHVDESLEDTLGLHFVLQRAHEIWSTATASMSFG